jgi:hypothetical protein
MTDIAAVVHHLMQATQCVDHSGHLEDIRDNVRETIIHLDRIGAPAKQAWGGEAQLIAIQCEDLGNQMLALVDKLTTAAQRVARGEALL